MKTVIDFYAEWCAPCKRMLPIIDELTKDLKTIKFIKIDVDKKMDKAAKYNVQSLPTLIILKDGKEIDRLVGFKTKEEIVKVIDGG